MKALAVLAAATLLVGAACAGAGADKAGGRSEPMSRVSATPVGKPVTLTLVTVDELWASEFSAAAARLSGGSIRIRTRIAGQGIVDYERSLVRDVRAGKAELASVGARAWDRMRVTSFQGLVAPFLVDSLELQRRILDGPRVERMLAGVEPLGLVGLAVLPGPLRRPLGLSRPLVGPQDYVGATIGIRYGRVAEASLRALGATAKGYRIGSLAGLDGAELDLTTIANNGYDKGAQELTANVVLWARPETIVIRRDAFRRLAPAQRTILRRAGREAVAPVLARLEREQQEALGELCDRPVALGSASASQLAALRAAVRPVYGELERDARTRRLLADVRTLKPGTVNEPLRCPTAAAAAPRFEGSWSGTAARDELLAAGASPKETRPGKGTMTLELGRGRWSARLDPDRVWTGTYAVTGGRIRFTLATCSHNPCDPGSVAEQRWSVYRDTLSLSDLPGRPSWWQLTTPRWKRAR